MAMEVEAAGPSLDPGGSATAAHRLYHQSDASSQSTEVYAVASEDSSYEGFVQAVSKKAKRRTRLREGLSSSSTSTVIAARGPPAHTVLFVPQTTTDNLNVLDREATSVFLDGLVPGGIKYVRVNPYRNVIAIYVKEQSAVDRLTAISEVGDISVRLHIHQDAGTKAGVIYNVEMAISDADLSVLFKPASYSLEFLTLNASGRLSASS